MATAVWAFLDSGHDDSLMMEIEELGGVEFLPTKDCRAGWSMIRYRWGHLYGGWLISRSDMTYVHVYVGGCLGPVLTIKDGISAVNGFTLLSTLNTYVLMTTLTKCIQVTICENLMSYNISDRCMEKGGEVLLIIYEA